MTNSGYVLEIKGNMALVRFLRESACGGNCASCGGCASKPIEKWIENTLDVSKGDTVYVKSSSGKILWSAFILYIVPLIMFFIGYYISCIFLSEKSSSIIGVIAFFMSFIIVKRYGSSLDVKFEMIKKV